MKIKLFHEVSVSDLEQDLIDFIEGKNVIDITILDNKGYTAMVMYEEPSEENVDTDVNKYIL